MRRTRLCRYFREPGRNGDAHAQPGSGIEVETAAILLEVVAEKTGYPVDMLELDMQLDADLGIDSIKRVEILSAIQDRLPDAPAVKPEHLGSLRTLRQIAEFLAPPASPGVAILHPGRNGDGHLPATTIGTATSVADILLEVVAEKTGYPADMLELDMQLDADLGIDSIKRVEILSAIQDRIPEAPAVKPENLGTLRTLRQIAEFLAGSPDRRIQAETNTPTKTKEEVAAPSQPVALPAERASVRSVSLDRLVARSVALDFPDRRERGEDRGRERNLDHGGQLGAHRRDSIPAWATWVQSAHRFAGRTDIPRAGRGGWRADRACA